MSTASSSKTCRHTTSSNGLITLEAVMIRENRCADLTGDRCSGGCVSRKNKKKASKPSASVELRFRDHSS